MRRWPCLFGVSTCGWLWIESIDFPFIHYVYTNSIRYVVLQCLWLIYRRVPSFNISQQWRALLKHTCLMILRLTRWFINGEKSHVPYNGNVGAISHFQTHPYIIVHHQISSYLIIYHHMSSYIIIYHHISSYIIIYQRISSYIIIYHSVGSMSN